MQPKTVIIALLASATAFASPLPDDRKTLEARQFLPAPSDCADTERWDRCAVANSHYCLVPNGGFLGLCQVTCEPCCSEDDVDCPVPA